MYFLVSGLVTLCYPHRYASEINETLRAGGFFGNFNIFSNDK